MRVVVCDTGPVLHLSEAGALDLLERAGEVLLPATVDHEIARHIPDWPTRRPHWIQVDAIRQSETPFEQWAAQLGLGAGEVEAIVLAKSRAADWLLTDDATARIVATLLGLEVHGSLGVVLWAAASTHINRPEADAILQRLASSSLWISPAILAEARRALDAPQP